MEAFAGGAAIIALASETLRIYGRLDRCFKNLKGAREDVRTVCSEIEMFSLLLTHFHTTVSQSEAVTKSLSTAVKTLVIPRIVKDGKHTIKKIKRLLHRLHPLRSDKSTSLLANATARYLWLNRRQKVFEIIINLGCIKSTAAWLTSLISLNLEVQELRNSSLTQAGRASVPTELVEQM